VVESFSRWRVHKDTEALLFQVSDGDIGIPEQHAHKELEVHFVASGELTLLGGGERVRAVRGMLVVIAPGFHHLALRSDGVERYAMLVRERMARRVLPTDVHRRWFGTRGWSQRQLSPQMTSRLTRQLREAVVAQRAHQGSLWNAIASQTLAMFAIGHEGGGDALGGAQMHAGVVRAIELLRGPDAPSTMGALAPRCGMSESHLSHMFATQVGVSVTDFRNQCRLGRFLELNEQRPNDSLMNLAIDAGFGSYPQFHRVFIALMGETPAAYRRRGSPRPTAAPSPGV